MTIDFGVSHGDDNFIMFHQAEPVESLKSEEDAMMSKKLVSMWTRFATYGKVKLQKMIYCDTFFLKHIF